MTAKMKYRASDLGEFRIRFEFQQKLMNSRDPHEFVTEITGTLNVFNEDSDSFDIPAGQILLQKIEIERAWETKAPLFEIFDSVDSELAELFENFFDIEENDFHPHLENLVHPGFGSDLLIVERVEIDPEYRGQDLGLLLVSRAIDALAGGCQYVATKPFPLQFGLYKKASVTERNTKGFDKFNGTEAAATKKISNHWKKLGFVELPDEPKILITSPAVRRT